MFLVIDNYDSFVHNLARYIQRTGQSTKIVRNDAITLKDIEELKPESIILSPGPCTPKEAGLCVEIVKEFGSKIPILGVCLGHQAIAESYGCETVRSQNPTHGKSSLLSHDGTGLFHGIPNPMTAGRYHSLVIDTAQSSELIVTATSTDGTIMAVKHHTHPVYGIQFHPESILTPNGLALLQNFVEIAKSHNETKDKAA